MMSFSLVVIFNLVSNVGSQFLFVLPLLKTSLPTTSIVALLCFLDASKAFDLVDHGILFNTLLERGLPLSIVRFLISWYSMQQLRVRWNSSLSDPLKVSNGVRQGSVLSPILFFQCIWIVCWLI